MAAGGAGSDPACAALAAAVPRLAPREAGALLAAVAGSPGGAAARLLREGAVRWEREGAAAAAAFGARGVGAAADAVAAAAAGTGGGRRAAADAAAALADMVAASGANKERLMTRPGAVEALVLAIRGDAGAGDGAGGEGAGELALQAFRALGNLCYGWDVDAAKEAVDRAGGVTAAVSAAATAAARPSGAGAFRWAAHALRNLSVRSPLMQSRVGDEGGVETLLDGLRAPHVAAAARAMESGCKALAYVVKGHRRNRLAAVNGGALALGAAALSSNRGDVATLEAALTLLCHCCAAESPLEGGTAGCPRAVAAALACGAHVAAQDAVRALLQDTCGDGACAPAAAAVAAGDEREPGRPSTHESLVGSAVWLYATFICHSLSALDEGGRATLAATLTDRGLERLLDSDAGRRARMRRAKVGSAVDECLRRLRDARGKGAPTQPSSQAATATRNASSDEDCKRCAGDERDAHARDCVRAIAKLGARVRELKVAATGGEGSGSEALAAALDELAALKDRSAGIVEAAIREAAAAGKCRDDVQTLLNALPSNKKRALEKELRKASKQRESTVEALQVDAAAKRAAGGGASVDAAIAGSDARCASAGDGISDADLACCVRVIDALSDCDDRSGTTDWLESPRFRKLRKALQPLHEAHAQKHQEISEYARRRQLQREEDARRTRQAAQDKRHRDTTTLRRGRIERLKQLCEDASVNGAPLAIENGAGQSAREMGDAIVSDDGGMNDAARALQRVPDGAVRITGGSGVDHEPELLEGSAFPDGSFNPALSAAGAAAVAAEGAAGPTGGPELHTAKQCYICKARFTQLHHFYAQLCPPCAALNYRMRNAAADLTGRVALLTGARVKIGYETGLKLLRAGATLIATTRFPADAARRYAEEPDFGKFRHRLHLHGLDLRDVVTLEAFCAWLNAHLPRLDIIVNNACQTVRRPAAFYSHLMAGERAMASALALLEGCRVGATDSESGGVTTVATRAPVAAEVAAPLFAQQVMRARGASGRGTPVAASGQLGPASDDAGGCVRSEDRDDAGGAPPAEVGHAPSAVQSAAVAAAELSQLQLTPEDRLPVTAAGPLPAGRLDVNGQQIDLRESNSWRLKLEDVQMPELVEVMAINTLAPFILNARLQPLLAATAAEAGCAFIVNVSAMEGKFYRHKTANHPHTNMAKAALNMMTRTSAADLAREHRIYMTAVDTGWINDENPAARAARTAAASHFQTPIDEVDAAARVLHPVFHGLATDGEPLHGVFLKDFSASEW
eukprot:PRCOL_00005181-RA